MNKKTKLTLVIASVLLVVVLAATFIGAATTATDSMAIIKHVLGIETLPEDVDGDVDGDKDVDVFDALIALKLEIADKALVYSISLDDDSYDFDFDRNTYEYTVKLPAGHPAVPRVTAEGVEGVTVEIQQAFLTADATSANAYVAASNGNGNVTEYTITFEKSEDAGFELQYDDRYTFAPTAQLAEGEAFTFTSSNPEIVAVDASTGEMTAKKVSKEDVTITATCGDVTETMIVTEVEKAHVNLFLLTGQSNGQGCYGNADDKADQAGYISFDDNIKEVPEIGVDGAVYSYDVYPYKNCVPANTLYDMNDEKRTGPAAALGKEFYELSGEKVVFLQSAYSGAPIQSWLDTETQKEAGYYKPSKNSDKIINFYDDTQKAYADLMAYLDANNYEVIRTCNFWWHGGTATRYAYVHEMNNYDFDGTTNTPLITDEEYYDLYMMMHEDMIRDFGLDYDFMILNRIQAAACSAESKALYRHTDLVPVRAAQFALANSNCDIIMASTVGDIATPYAAADQENPGWNYVGLDNVHFNQIGHNATGAEAGTNAFNALKRIYTVVDNREAADHVEIIDTNGRDRLTAEDTIELKVGSTYRIAALAYPIYTEDITYSSSKTSVATINEFGVITAVSDGYAMITATSDSGKTQSVEVYVYSVKQVPTTYRWEFDDLTATGTKNDLTVSAASKYYGADKNYTTVEGIYSVTDAGSSKESARPDFEMDKPITLTSENSWTLEWCGKMKAKNGVLMGPTQTEYTSSTSVYPFLYIYSANQYVNKGINYGYPLKIALSSNDTKNIFLDFGEYRSYLSSDLHKWMLKYDNSNKTMYLCFYNQSTTTWETVDSKPVGDFDMTLYSLFGRAKGNGGLGYYGDMDYIQVDFVQEVIIQEKNYRYEFNGNLLSSKDKNDLTLSPDAEYREAIFTDASYVDDGEDDKMYKSTAKSPLRPDFLFEKKIKVSSEMDWTVEWKADLAGASQLLGQSLTEPSDNGKVQYGCIYIAYPKNSHGALRFKLPDGVNEYKLYYDDTNRAYNTSMNTWRLMYTANDQKMKLQILLENTWQDIDEVNITAQYEFYFTNLFGTYKTFCNLSGTVDYVDIYTKETIYQ